MTTEKDIEWLHLLTKDIGVDVLLQGWNRYQ